MTAQSGVPALAVLGGIVIMGISSGAAYFHYKEPRLKAELAERLAAAPKTPKGRLAAWHVYGQPNIHRRLAIVGRFSEQTPWLVTHAIDDGSGSLEVWGVDCESLSVEISRIEGMTVVVELPAPSVVGRLPLEGGHRAHVVVFTSRDAVSDANLRLEKLARFFLEGMPAALEQDIEGATLEIRVISASTEASAQPTVRSES